jgi:hypothetical protein
MAARAVGPALCSVPQPKEATMETKQVTGRVGKAVGATILVVGLAAGVTIGARRSPPAAATPVPPPVAAATPAPATAAARPSAAKHQARLLQTVNRTELEHTLPRNARVEITASEQDAEAFGLAQEIYAYLRSQGYQAESVTPAGDRRLPPGVGLEPFPDGHWRVLVGAEE